MSYTDGALKQFVIIISGTFFKEKIICLLNDIAISLNIKVINLNKMNKNEIVQLFEIDTPTKQSRGQFYTTNVDKILQGINIPKWVDHIIEPFVGQGDLIEWLKTKKINNECIIDMYDIEPKLQNAVAIKQDSLLNPPDYEGAYILTNPPYLSRNKCTDSNVKKIFDAHLGVSDLFRINIAQITGKCIGGILIIPLNFMSSSSRFIRDNQIRDDFLSNYKITALNLFEEQVFDDTSYTVIAFRFVWSDEKLTEQTIAIKSFPDNKMLLFTIKKKYDWIIGGEIYYLPIKSGIRIKRMVLGALYDDWIISKIYVNAIDGGTATSMIKLEYKKEPFYGKISDRAFATLVIQDTNGTDYLTDKFQKYIILEFNKLLLTYRKKYNSLFLTNYRESKNGNGRKRISFETIYRLLSYIIMQSVSTHQRIIECVLTNI